MVGIEGVHRYQVLSLYRQILRIARKWTSASGQGVETSNEKSYIQEEARRLFKKNKEETCEEKIKEHIKEAETRLGLAMHYGTPYPRMANIPQNVLPPKGRLKYKKDQRVLHQSTPVYLKSYDDETKPEK